MSSLTALLNQKFVSNFSGKRKRILKGVLILLLKRLSNVIKSLTFVKVIESQ